MQYRQIRTMPPEKYNFPKTEFDFVFLAVAKCASTSVRNAMGEWRTLKVAVDLEHACQYATRLTIIRHPFNRMVSAWRHLAPGMPWDEFVPYAVERKERDLYFAPFADKVAAATTVLTLENLFYTWPSFQADHPWLPRELPCVNTTASRNQERDPPHTAMDELILRHYRDDVVVWRQVFVEETAPAVLA